jgi:hypothetical protein
MTDRSRSGSFTSGRPLGWRRVAAGLLLPLLAVIVLQVRYYAPHHIEDVNLAGSSAEQPLAASTSAPPITIAPPQPGAERFAGPGSFVSEVRPLRPFQERAPPAPAR